MKHFSWTGALRASASRKHRGREREKKSSILNSLTTASPLGRWNRFLLTPWGTKCLCQWGGKRSTWDLGPLLTFNSTQQRVCQEWRMSNLSSCFLLREQWEEGRGTEETNTWIVGDLSNCARTSFTDEFTASLEWSGSQACLRPGSRIQELRTRSAKLILLFRSLSFAVPKESLCPSETAPTWTSFI